MTIDDGPHPRWTPQVLDLLEEHQVTATFFLIGANVERHPALARRIAAAGHVIGNHDSSQTIEALRTVIPELQRRGLRFAPL